MNKEDHVRLEAEALYRSYRAYLKDLLDDLYDLQLAAKYPALGLTGIEATCNNVVRAITRTSGRLAFEQVNDTIDKHPDLASVVETIFAATTRREVPRLTTDHFATIGRFTDEIYADFVKAGERFKALTAKKD